MIFFMQEDPEFVSYQVHEVVVVVVCLFACFVFGFGFPCMLFAIVNFLFNS